MRVRELLGRLHHKITLTPITKDKRLLIDLCSQIERSETELRRHRLTGEAIIHGSHGRIGVLKGWKQGSATDSRLEALLARLENVPKGAPGSPEVPDMPTAT